jgi:hypothetical protein
MNAWKIRIAPLHSNIIWKNFFAESLVTTLKAYLLNILVFTLALTFVTPVYFIKFLKEAGVSETLKSFSLLSDVNSEYIVNYLFA